MGDLAKRKREYGEASAGYSVLDLQQRSVAYIAALEAEVERLRARIPDPDDLWTAVAAINQALAYVTSPTARHRFQGVRDRLRATLGAAPE